MHRVWALGSALVIVAACAPTDEEINRELAAYVKDRDRCVRNEDCALVPMRCPLPCAVAVSREHRLEVDEKAVELIRRYESGGQTCDYKCGPSVAVCEQGRCTDKRK
jgi:hypothetical protein